MNPNKKSLNSKNNNSPWLLCPSKSFPGKFYYFNGSTGETAWSLSESDHNNLKKDTIHKVSDNAHPYPEPFGPPGDESTNTSYSSTLKKEFNNTGNFIKTSFPNTSAFSKGMNFNFTDHRFGLGSNPHGEKIFSNISKPSPISFQPVSPMFGQATFPTYVSNKGPKVIWALTPMLVNDQKQQMLDQIMQYEPPNTFLQPPLVLNNQLQTFKQKNPFKVNPTPKVAQTGMPMFATKVTCDSKDVQTLDLKCQTKDEACQTFEPKTIETQTVPVAHCSSSSSKSVLRPSKLGEKSLSIGISTLSLAEGNEDVTNIEDNTNKLSELKENDLRLFLVAKRRKSVHFREVLKSTTNKESPKILTEQKTPKKRVTFDLDDKEAESPIQDYVTPDVNCASISSMEALKSPNSDRIWYIVADSDILITDYNYVERNVLDGQNCRLLVPYVVRAEIEATSRGECRDKQHIVAARLVARKLTAPSPYIVLQRKPGTTSSRDEYSILDCCYQYSRDDCDLTLITASSELFEKARLVGIDCNLYDPRPGTIDIPVNETREALEHTLVNKKAFTAKSIEFAKRFKSVDDNHSEPFDLDISKLDITDQHLNKKNQDVINVCNKRTCETDVNYSEVKNYIKVSGITKLNDVFNLDDELARYRVKNEVMEARLVTRIDEWECRLFQATEGALIDTLWKEKVKKGMPPQNFSEAIGKIGTAFTKQPKIRNIVNKLRSHLKNSNVAVASKYDKTKPADFIKLLGFCKILIQSLKEVVDYVELNDSNDLLSELIRHIEDPNTDVELNLDIVQTPSDKELEKKVPVGYRTKQSDVLEYVKKHFASMQSCEIEKTKPNIVRTVGKDLKSIKVFNTKAIVVDNIELKTDLTCNVVEPVVLKNFKIIEAFEEKLKKHKEDILDYEEYLSTRSISGDTYVIKDDIDSTYKKTDNIVNGRNISAEHSDMGESLSSDLNNECIYAYPLMKAFLAELRRTLILIFNFVSDNMQDLQQNSMCANKRQDLEIKMRMAHKYLLKIISRLKSIITREAGQGKTVKMLLIQAGDYVEEDETMSHYKELVTKYLEQAGILEEALNIMMTIEHDDLDEVSNNGTPSVILPQ